LSDAPAEQFDEAYYEKYYENARTRVTTPAEVARLARFVTAYLSHMRLPVRRVLDMGCGLGYWRAPVAEAYPSAKYVGVEYSEYLCGRHGWHRGSVVDYRARAPFDLVICQGVLQYLPDREAALAIDNLAQLCRGALYLEVLTREDWQDNCDRSRTDPALRLRLASWYRRKLGTHFSGCGGGVFLRHSAPVTLYELERTSPR